MTDLRQAAQAALENLEAVLCDPEGRAGIHGSDGDLKIIDEALDGLRAALAAQPVAFDHDIGADRYQVVKGPFWWRVRIGDSTANVGKFHTKMAAEDMALKLLTAFRDGAFMQSRAAQPVAWGQLGLLNGKTYLRMNYDRTPYPPPADVVRNLNLVPLYAAAQPPQAFSMKTLVDRFLTWPVPAEVYPDGTPGQPGRTGTNLLNAQQAQAMLEHVLAAQPQQAPLKERPDFVAGYDAGLADGRRIAEREQAAQPGAQEPRVCWLVEEFSDSGNSTGRYMQDQNGLTITTDVQKARRFRRSRTATFRATDMREKWGTAWRPVSHLFASAQPQQAAPCDEEIGWLIEHRAAEHTLWWSGEFCPADDEYRSVRLIARMSNDANNAVRFVRKEDAQRVLDAMLAARPSPILARAPELYSVTEHMWTAAAQPPQD